MKIELYQLPPAYGGQLPSMSPFCTKVELYLKLRKLPYTLQLGDPRKAPKGKVPWVVIDGSERVGDSTLIVERLEERLAPGLDAWMTAEQRARARAFRRMLEEATYFGLPLMRWREDDGYRHMRDYYLPFLPKVIGGVALAFVRKSIVKQAWGQGIGRHSQEEVFAMLRDDFDALAEEIGDRPYAMGAQPSTLDCTAYPFIIAYARVPWDSEIKRHVLSKTNLIEYAARIDRELWPS